MNFSFCSQSPLFLQCDGVIKNEFICKDIKTFNLPLKSLIRVEFVNGGTKNLLLDNGVIEYPPKYISVTDLKGGFMIDFKAVPKRGEFKILARKVTPEITVTLFYLDGLKLWVKTERGVFTDGIDDFIPTELPCAPVLDLLKLRDGFMISIKIQGENNFLAVYSVFDFLKREGTFLFDDYILNDTMTIIQKKKDVLKHTVKTVFTYERGLPVINCEVTSEKSFSDISTRAIPYAFLEEFSLGKTADEVLSDGIKEHADKLKGYLGEFIGVFPPPFFRRFDEIGVIKKRAENLYFSDYIKVDMTDGKISNIKISE